MLNCNDGTSQGASYSKVCAGFAGLVDDLDKVNDRVSKLKQDVKDLQKQGVSNEQQLSIDLVKKLQCKVAKLFRSHEDMERSVNTNVNSIQQRLSAIEIQLEELANLTPPMANNMPNNRDLVDNTGLEQPIRMKSDPVMSKGDWSGRDDVKQVIDGLRSELKQIKEDIGAGYGERSFLKLLKQFLDTEMEQRSHPRTMSVTSVDSGLESSVNQLDTPSSEGSSIRLSLSRQQSNISNSSQRTSETRSCLENSFQINASVSSLPLASSVSGRSSSASYVNLPPVRAVSTDSSGVMQYSSLSAGNTVVPCSCSCEERLDRILQSLSSLVNDNLKEH